jgi:HAD superfamily hydrolase (TIGR01509 family)
MIRLSPPGLAPRRLPSKSNESRKQTEELYRHLVSRIGIAYEPGVARRLRRLHKRGWQQAIASAAPRANIGAVLEALSASHIFQSIVSAEDVHRGKPDPEVYLLAASRVGVAAERCIVLEDASAGIEGGRRAGMRTLG